MIKLIRGFFAFVGIFYMKCRKKNIVHCFSLMCAMAGCHGSRVKFPWPLSSSRYIKAQKGILVLCVPLSNIKIHKYINEFAFPERLRDRVAGAFVKFCNTVVSSLKIAASIKVGGMTVLGMNLIMVNMSRSLSGNPTKLITVFSRGFPQKPNCGHTTCHVTFPPVFSKDFPPPSSGEKTLLGSPVFLLAHLIKLSFPIHWKRLNRQKKSFKSGCKFFPRRLPHPHWVTTGQAGFSDMGPALSLISHKTAKNRIPAVRTIAFDKLVWELSGFSKEFIESAVVFSSSS